MKTEKNQHVGSIGVISTVSLLAICFLAFTPFWNSKNNEKNEKSTRRAESLAYQILEAQRVSTESISNSRQPASEASLSHLTSNQGEVGNDEWGRPFQFKTILGNDSKKNVIVWSTGANGKNESNFEDANQFSDGKGVLFSGDDVGIAISVK